MTVFIKRAESTQLGRLTIDQLGTTNFYTVYIANNSEYLDKIPFNDCSLASTTNSKSIIDLSNIGTFLNQDKQIFINAPGQQRSIIVTKIKSDHRYKGAVALLIDGYSSEFNSNVKKTIRITSDYPIVDFEVFVTNPSVTESAFLSKTIVQTSSDGLTKTFTFVMDHYPYYIFLYFNEIASTERLVAGDGLRYEFWSLPNLLSPPAVPDINTLGTKSGKHATIDFEWSSPPFSTSANSSYGFRWAGWIVPQKTNTYIFAIEVDNGAVLSIDNTAIINKWDNQEPIATSPVQYSEKITPNNSTDYGETPVTEITILDITSEIGFYSAKIGKIADIKYSPEMFLDWPANTNQIVIGGLFNSQDIYPETSNVYESLVLFVDGKISGMFGRAFITIEILNPNDVSEDILIDTRFTTTRPVAYPANAFSVNYTNNDQGKINKIEIDAPGGAYPNHVFLFFRTPVLKKLQIKVTATTTSAPAKFWTADVANQIIGISNLTFKTATATWNKSPNKTGSYDVPSYEINLATNDNFTLNKQTQIINHDAFNLPSYTFTNLESNTTYYVRVRTFYQGDGPDIIESWSPSQLFTTSNIYYESNPLTLDQNTPYPIKLDYFNGRNNGKIKLYWKTTSTDTLSLIPTNVLYSTYTKPESTTTRPVLLHSYENSVWREATPYIKTQNTWVVIDPDSFKIDFAKIGSTAIVQDTPLPEDNLIEQPINSYVKVDGKWMQAHPQPETSLDLTFKYSVPEDVFITILTGGAGGGRNYNQQDFELFRERHPTNKLFIVRSNSTTELYLPTGFDGTVLTVPPDQDGQNPTPDWFSLFGLDQAPPRTLVQLAFDSIPWNPSTGTGRVYSQKSIDVLRNKCDLAGLDFTFTSGGSTERWAGAHIRRHSITLKLNHVQSNGTPADRGEIHWGDGESTLIADTSSLWKTYSHIYETPGEYNVVVDTKGSQRTISGVQINDRTLRRINKRLPKWNLNSCDFSKTTIKDLPVTFFSNNPNLSQLKNCFKETLLETVPQSLLKQTINITTMEGCFEKCLNLVSISEDLFKYNITNIHLGRIFNDCKNLTSIPEDLFSNPLAVPGPGPYKAYQMFRNTNISVIPLNLFTHFQTTTDFFGSFENTKVSTIPANLFENCREALNLSSMFRNTNIAHIPSSLFQGLNKVTNIQTIFANCLNLETVPVDTFKDLISLINCAGVFQSCNNFSTIPSDLLKHNIRVNQVSHMFYHTKITSIPQNLFAYCPILNFTNTFADCKELTTIPVGLFDSNTEATSFEGTFRGCNVLEQLPVNLFINNTNVTNFKKTFQNCSNILTDGRVLAFPYLWDRSPEPIGTDFASSSNDIFRWYIPIHWGGLGNTLPPAEYNKVNFQYFTFSGKDPNISNVNIQDSGIHANIDRQYSFKNEYGHSQLYGFIWTGWLLLDPLNPLQEYYFRVYSDDGFRFYLDNNKVLEHWRDSSTGSRYDTAPLTFVQNSIPLRLEWYNNFGPSQIKLQWKTRTDITFVTIPSEAFHILSDL